MVSPKDDLTGQNITTLKKIAKLTGLKGYTKYRKGDERTLMKLIRESREKKPFSPVRSSGSKKSIQPGRTLKKVSGDHFAKASSSKGKQRVLPPSLVSRKSPPKVVSTRFSPPRSSPPKSDVSKSLKCVSDPCPKGMYCREFPTGRQKKCVKSKPATDEVFEYGGQRIIGSKKAVEELKKILMSPPKEISPTSTLKMSLSSASGTPPERVESVTFTSPPRASGTPPQRVESVTFTSVTPQEAQFRFVPIASSKHSDQFKYLKDLPISTEQKEKVIDTLKRQISLMHYKDNYLRVVGDFEEDGSFRARFEHPLTADDIENILTVMGSRAFEVTMATVGDWDITYTIDSEAEKTIKSMDEARAEALLTPQSVGKNPLSCMSDPCPPGQYCRERPVGRQKRCVKSKPAKEAVFEPEVGGYKIIGSVEEVKDFEAMYRAYMDRKENIRADGKRYSPPSTRISPVATVIEPVVEKEKEVQYHECVVDGCANGEFCQAKEGCTSTPPQDHVLTTRDGRKIYGRVQFLNQIKKSVGGEVTKVPKPEKIPEPKKVVTSATDSVSKKQLIDMFTKCIGKL